MGARVWYGMRCGIRTWSMDLEWGRRPTYTRLYVHAVCAPNSAVCRCFMCPHTLGCFMCPHTLCRCSMCPHTLCRCFMCPHTLGCFMCAHEACARIHIHSAPSSSCALYCENENVRGIVKMCLPLCAMSSAMRAMSSACLCLL